MASSSRRWKTSAAVIPTCSWAWPISRWWWRDNDPPLGLRLAVGLRWFWVFRRALTEGEGWLEGFLARTSGEPEVRGRALLALATLKRDRGNLAADAAIPLFHFEWDGVEFADYEQALAETRVGLATDAFVSAWTEGQAMMLEQAMAYSLRDTTDA